MDKTAIKNYAIWARTKLIGDIKYKASLLGITEKGIADALAQSTTQEQYFDIGMREPYAIRGVQLVQRQSLVKAIERKAQDSDYQTAYNSIIEEVAYTWFNRFIAVRFMEVNEYLPCKIRVLSAVDGRQEPDIVQNPFDAKLDYTRAEEELISQYQMNNESDKLFNMLFVKVCNDLSKVLPQLFEAEQDYTELLLNISYTDRDGLIYKLVHDIPENNFDVNALDEEGKPIGQVEIIGWLYQYYNTEPKNETFVLLKKNVKITKERIPSATQLFTPDWIVRYMVENSLGRLVISGQCLADSEEERIAKEKELAERFSWKYYLPEAKQDAVVVDSGGLANDILTTNDYSLTTLKVIDPCMGSGHILVYAFDVLMQIYTQMGYTDKDAALSILENNLYGLDIDKRAFQLAYFAVLMKARQYHKFILKKQPKCHIYAIAESNGINMKHLDYFGAQLDELNKNNAYVQMQGLIEAMHDAKEYGSIISVPAYDWNLLREFAAEFDISVEMNLFDTFGIEVTQLRLQELINVGEVLAQKYEVVVTNPPYMGSSGMGEKLSKFVKQNYPDSKSDLFAVFIEKGNNMVCAYGYNCMVTMQSWMFLSSFETMRKNILQKKVISNLMHMENMVLGIAFGTAVSNFRNCMIKGYKGTYNYIKLKDIVNGVPAYFPVKENRFAQVSSDNFAKISGAPVAYWVSENAYKAFNGQKLYDIAKPRQGLATTNNDLFLKLWFEVYSSKIGFYMDREKASKSLKKWFPINKGGVFRRWYGNFIYIVNYEHNGKTICDYIDNTPGVRVKSNGRVINRDKYFLKGMTWSTISSGLFSMRYVPDGFIFETKGAMCFTDDDKLLYLLGLYNTPVIQEYLRILSPTLDYHEGPLGRTPVIIKQDKKIDDLVQQNIYLSKTDWDSFETSWDFQKHPLVLYAHSTAKPELDVYGKELSYYLESAYQTWEDECQSNFDALKANEEELNRIFIDIYGLQDELTPEVEDKDVTVRKADLQRDIKSLLSYAVGCMFGRYSLDVEGLAFAGGAWDESKYVTFKPDDDNVIPITDEDYFEDDIVGRLIVWLKIVYGTETLEENLRFIADALGNAGDTPRQKIRNYFLKEFFKDHCKIYQKRPIYWLYDSGKQNGFKALIYMHRYNADTSGQVRAEYLGKMEETYESEINRMQDIIDNGAGREVALAGKRKEKLQKQLHECREYDAVLGHIALARIAIDLDDGVKVNYVKVQTAKDVKVLQVLAKI